MRRVLLSVTEPCELAAVSISQERVVMLLDPALKMSAPARPALLFQKMLL